MTATTDQKSLSTTAAATIEAEGEYLRVMMWKGFLEEINWAWRPEVEAEIKTATLVANLKEHLGITWRTFADEQPLPFDKSTCQMLARIGRNPALTDESNYGRLPGKLNVLRRLAGLPPDDLQFFIDEGRVHPRLSIKEAVAMLPTKNHRVATDERTKAIRRMKSFAEKVANLTAGEPDFASQFLEIINPLRETLTETAGKAAPVDA